MDTLTYDVERFSDTSGGYETVGTVELSSDGHITFTPTAIMPNIMDSFINLYSILLFSL